MSMTNASNDTIILNTDNSTESNSSSIYDNDRINVLENSISSMKAINNGLNDRMDSFKTQLTQSKTDLSNEINFLAVSLSVQLLPNNWFGKIKILRKT